MPKEDKPTQSETPEQPAETVAPVEPAKQEIQPKPAEDVVNPWDGERAKSTIDSLHAQKKVWQQEHQELEKLRAEKQARDEAEMTELEKANKRIAEFEAQNAEMQSTIWRQQAATEANLPSIFAERVKGKTLEEMKEDALKLAEVLSKSNKPPNPKLNATNPANGEKTETDAEKRARLFGTPGDVFDMQNILAQGGGVLEFANSNANKAAREGEGE